MLPDGLVAAGTDRGVVFSSAVTPQAPPIIGPRAYAAPTVAADGRAVIVTLDKSVTGIRNRAVISQVSVSGASVVRAAASRTHIFVSTTSGLHTLDATGQTDVLRFPWVSGGISPPTIGPDGRVYAMTSNILLVFPPPARVPRRPGLADVTERLT
jgi:hypothetical protein